MTTIDTVEDIIAALDADPALLSALRARLLSEDVLQLPATVNRFVEATDRRIAALEETVAAINARIEKLEEAMVIANARLEKLETTLQTFMAATNARLEKLEEAMVIANARLDSLEAGQQRLEAGQQRLEANQQRLEANQQRLEASQQRLEAGQQRLEAGHRSLENEFGDLKGLFVENALGRKAKDLARRMGFSLKFELTDDDIERIVREADTTGVSDDDLRSFEDADMILLVEDSSGAERYLPVEASYTVHTDDVARSRRNAELLTMWTGAPAQPVVAGITLHDLAWERVASTDTTFFRVRNRDIRSR